jgi:O-antigen ligase
MASDILQKRKLVFRLLSITAILFSMAAVTAYQSRGGMILIVLAISLIGLFHKPRWFLPVAGTSLALGLLVDSFLGFPLLQKMNGTWHSRLPPWLAAWEMFADAPWIGHGPRSFGELYAQYQRQLQLPERLFLDKRNMPWAHNLYLETLAEQGIIGLLFLLLFLGKLLLSLWKKIKAQTQAPPLHVKCALGSLLVLLVAGMFELSFIRLWFVVLFFALSAIIAILTMPNHPEGAP